MWAVTDYVNVSQCRLPDMLPALMVAIHNSPVLLLKYFSGFLLID